jgi:hypothetical protein
VSGDDVDLTRCLLSEQESRRIFAEMTVASEMASSPLPNQMPSSFTISGTRCSNVAHTKSDWTLS